MESSGRQTDRAAPNRLDDIRMSAFDRLAAQRYLDAGAALADVVLGVSHRIRSAIRHRQRVAKIHKPASTARTP